MYGEKEIIQELNHYGVVVEKNEKETLDILKSAGTNPNAGIDMNIKPIEECRDETEYWGQYRGDYIDLRDFLRAKNLDDKKTFLKNLSKGRVILIREHLMQVWTFNPEQRERLEGQLEAINLVIYCGKDELEQAEQDIATKKQECGYDDSDWSDDESTKEEFKTV